MAVAPLLAPRARLLLCLDLQRSPAVEDKAAATRALDNCRRLLAYGRMAGWAVCHVYQRDASAGRAAAAAPLDGLAPLPTEPVFHRPGLSAFSSGPFRRLTETMPNAELVIMGLSIASSCVATVLAALDQDMAATLVNDAVAAGATDAAGLAAMQSVIRSVASVRVSRTDDLIDRRRSLRVVSG